MKKSILLLALGLFSSVTLLAATVDPAKTDAERSAPSNQELKHDVDRLGDDMKEIRRDQLNYQIERDLLKETYSSNIQQINIIMNCT